MQRRPDRKAENISNAIISCFCCKILKLEHDNSFKDLIQEYSKTKQKIALDDIAYPYTERLMTILKSYV